MARLIGIIGTSFCGSTLLDMVLNTHPEMIGVGEFYKVTDLYWDPSRSVSKVGCSCGNCPLVPISEFPIAGTHAHETVSLRAGVPWVVDSSKLPGYFKKLDDVWSPDRAFYILLLKEPPQAIASMVKHLHGDAPDWNPHMKASPVGDQISEVWCRSYQRAYAFVQGHDHMILPYSDFVRYSAKVMSRIAEALDVSDTWDLLHWGDASKHGIHKFAGNWSTRTEPKPIRPSIEWQKYRGDLSPEAVRQMWLVYNELVQKPTIWSA